MYIHVHTFQTCKTSPGVLTCRVPSMYHFLNVPLVSPFTNRKRLSYPGSGANITGNTTGDLNQACRCINFTTAVIWIQVEYCNSSTWHADGKLPTGRQGSLPMRVECFRAKTHSAPWLGEEHPWGVIGHLVQPCARIPNRILMQHFRQSQREGNP